MSNGDADKVCAECGAAHRAEDRFCSNCGARLAPSTSQAAPPRVSLDRLFEHLRQGEQRPATILMADISGFTALGERIDAEQLFQLINRVFHEFVEILVNHGAHIDKYVGDEVVALFGVPRAQEHSAERAVFAALAMRDRLEEMNIAGEFGEIRLGVHMGINIGPVMVGPVGHRSYLDYTVIGDAVNLAKRLETEAPEGEIYVSRAVCDAAGGACEFAAVGPIRVKGRETEVEVYRVTGAHPSERDTPEAAGHATPLLARDRELAALSRCAGEALAGAVRVVGVVGPAGIGKSKLVHSWRSAEGDRDFRVLATTCYSCGEQFPLLPLLDLVSQFGGARLEGWPPRVVLEETVPEAEPLTALVQLMQSPPAEPDPDWQGHLVARLAELLNHGASGQPLCLIVDNAQWMDESSREVLAQLAEALPTDALLMILSGRDPEGSWVTHLDPSDLLALPPLPRSAMETLIAWWARPTVLTRETLKAICDRADGHPYFARELVRGFRSPRGDRAAGGVLPGSLHELFLAQLDALAVPLRRLVQAASVVGEPFTVPVLQAALGAERGDATTGLQRALGQDLLQQSTLDGQYVFRRRLLFEAAYETIPPSQRQTLHTQIANHLVEHLTVMGESAVHAAAYHAYRGQRDARALDLLLRSAQRYRAQYSNRQAVRAATCALEVISSLPDPAAWSRERLQALLVVAQACTILGDLSTAEGTLAEAEIVAEDCADQELVARVALQAATCSLMLGDPEEAFRRFGRAGEAWRALGDVTRVAHALVGMGLCAQQQANRAGAVALFQEAAAMPGAESWVRAAALNNAGILLLEDGHYGQAEAQIRQGLAENLASSDRRGMAHSHCSLGEALYLRGELEEARAQLLLARDLAREIEDAQGVEETTLNLVRVLLALGAREEAHNLLQESEALPAEAADPQTVLLRQMLAWQVGLAGVGGEAWAAWCPVEGADSGACWNTYADGICLQLAAALAEGDAARTADLGAALTEALPHVLDRHLASYARWLMAAATDAGTTLPPFTAPSEPTLYDRRAAELRHLLGYR